jgi:DNA-binding MarR family transcriptional regulator
MSNPKDQVRDMRADHFFRIKNNVIDRHLFRIGLAGFAVYGVLARYAGNNTQRCFPSQRTISDVINCSPTTVRKALAVLEAEKLISVAQKGKAGRRYNVYTLLEGAKTVAMPRSKSDASESDRAPSKSDHAPSDSDHELDVTTRRKKLDEGEQGVATATTLPFPDSSDSQETLSGQDFAFCCAVVDRAGIKSLNRQNAGAVRSTWALTGGSQQERRNQFEAAIDCGACRETEAGRIFAVAMSFLKGRAA